MTVILDASALLAALHDEPGGEVVDQVLDGARMSAVNYAEVVSHFIHTGDTPSRADEILTPLLVTIVPADTELAKIAGRLRAVTARAGLSLGDRFCLALAIREGLEAWTADRRWADVADAAGAKVRLIR